VNPILERIKKAYHLETDAELATFLDINPSTLSMQKNRGRLNLQLIIQKCHDLNKNWLLHGNGPIWGNNQKKAERIEIPIYESVDLHQENGLKRKQGGEIGWLTAEGEVLDKLQAQTEKEDLLGYLISDKPVPPKLTKDDIAIINLANTVPEEGIFLTSRDNEIACRRLENGTTAQEHILGRLVWVMQKMR
jgi:hypothetical protein